MRPQTEKCQLHWHRLNVCSSQIFCELFHGTLGGMRCRISSHSTLGWAIHRLHHLCSSRIARLVRADLPCPLRFVVSVFSGGAVTDSVPHNLFGVANI